METVAAIHQSAKALAQSPLFRADCQSLTREAQLARSYARCKAVVSIYSGMTAKDVLGATKAYYDFHTDPILVMDGSVGTLLTIHYNLCIGTLAKYAHQPGVTSIVDRLLRYDLGGQYLLTEVGHGLDAFHLETRATLLPDGGFTLHTPHPRAAKYMPPTTPCGIATVAVVFARLFVGDEERGIKPFLVHLHDGHSMNDGIVTRLLPPRGGARAVGHALTYFNHVRLPSTALLGDQIRAADQKAAFFELISRVVVGTMSMGFFAVSAMRITSAVAAHYSMRRIVTDSVSGRRLPIISFGTQQIPVITAIAQAHVLNAFMSDVYDRFVNSKDSATKHLYAAVFKTTAFRCVNLSIPELCNRCGAQGLFEANQMSVILADMQGAAVAEGDVLGISIKFALDILFGRIEVPKSQDPCSLMARHEDSMIHELRQVLSERKHRPSDINTMVLPQCLPLIEAIGQRMAIEAAEAAGVDAALVDVFRASVVERDPAWYAQHGLDRAGQAELRRNAVARAMPHLDRYVKALDVEAYLTAPIVTDERWDDFESRLLMHSQDSFPSSVLARM